MGHVYGINGPGYYLGFYEETLSEDNKITPVLICVQQTSDIDPKIAYETICNQLADDNGLMLGLSTPKLIGFHVSGRKVIGFDGTSYQGFQRADRSTVRRMIKSHGGYSFC